MPCVCEALASTPSGRKGQTVKPKIDTLQRKQHRATVLRTRAETHMAELPCNLQAANGSREQPRSEEQDKAASLAEETDPPRDKMVTAPCAADPRENREVPGLPVRLDPLLLGKLPLLPSRKHFLAWVKPKMKTPALLVLSVCSTPSSPETWKRHKLGILFIFLF